jgi:hypothetical protein
LFSKDSTYTDLSFVSLTINDICNVDESNVGDDDNNNDDVVINVVDDMMMTADGNFNLLNIQEK